MKNSRFESEIKKDVQCSAKLIWADSVENTDEYCLFRKTFMCDKMPKSAILNIFVQSKYRLFINGEAVLRGNSGISEKGEISKIDVLAYLKQGKNVIAVFANYQAYPVSKIALRKKGVFFNLKLGYTGARQEEIVSDAAVKCRICDAYSNDSVRICYDEASIEVFDNTKFPSDWAQVDFDDFEWDYSQETPVCETNYFDMPQSEYKQLADHLYCAKAIVAAGAGDDKKGLDLKQTIYHENAKCQLNKIYVAGVECEIQPIDKGQHSYILVDFDRVCTGYLRIDVNGYGGDIIDAVFAKELQDGEPQISGAARFILRAENNVLETNFDESEFRYVLLVFRNPVRTNVVNGIWAIESKYPFENTSEFNCDSENLNAIYEDAVSRVKSRFSNQIICSNGLGRRNTIFSQRVLAVSNCYATGSLVHFKNMLTDFAIMHTKSGNVLNKRNFNTCFDFYDIFAFALAIKDYCGLSGDSNIAAEVFEKAVMMFRWISEFEQDGFLSPVLSRDELKSEALLNLSYIYALEALSYVGGLCSDRQAVRFYETKAAKLKKAFKQRFLADENAFIEENSSIIYDVCSLLMLVMDYNIMDRALGEAKNTNTNIYMPIEFIRATKKAENIGDSYNALYKGMLGFEVVPALIAENVLGIDLTGKKGIKSSPDIKNFSDVSAKIYSPKGVVDVSVKSGVIEKNMLSVNINQADGEF